MVGWHHRHNGLNGLNGTEFEQAPGDGDGQGSQAGCSPWGRKESDMTEQLHFASLHRLNGDEFEQTLEDSEGQGRLVCCSP